MRSIGWGLAVALAASSCGRGAAPPPAHSGPAVTVGESGEVRVRETVFGGEVYVREEGPAGAPVLVLVHGLGQRASGDFGPLFPALAARYRVVAVDLPGFGRSDGGNHLYSPDRLVAALDQVLSVRVGGPFVLVGHSMGGALSLLYAATHPQRVSRLVLIDAAGILHRDAYTRFLVHAQIDGALGSAVTTAMSPFARRSPDPALLLESELARGTVLGGDPNRIAALALILHDFGPALDGVRCPTLVLWGERDEVAPVRTARLLASRVPGARLEVLAGAGHVPMAEAPDWVASLILSFAESEPPVPPPPVAPNARVGSCAGEDGVTFEGAYDRIEIDRCRDVTLRDVVARGIVVHDSVAAIENVTVTEAPDAGLVLTESIVRVTGGRVRAPVCLRLSGSEVDMAGTVLECGDAAFVATDRSKLVLSVLRVTSRRGHGTMHEVRVLDSGQSL